VKIVLVVLGLAGALTIQATLSGLFTGGNLAVNLVLVGVVYVALAFGADTGLLAGAVCGLVQDALGGGIVGIGGMTKTLIGCFVGALSAQFNLSTLVPRLVMFVAATFVHELMFGGLQAIAGGRPFAVKLSAVLVQALLNGLIGVLAFVLVENGPQLVANRRIRRASLTKRRY
jgi:rod shape-determining protein MreD